MSEPTLLYVSEVAPYAGTPPAPAGVHRSLAAAGVLLEEIASLLGLGFETSSRVTSLSIQQLQAARILALFTIGETPWNAEQRRLIEARYRSGDLGVVGLHAATDSAYGWPAFGEMLGARFNGHPITGQLSISVVDARHPATAHLTPPWKFHEELYIFRELVPDARVLLGVELGTRRPEHEPTVLPLSWCLERGSARSFYTVLGHFLDAYEDSNYIQHLRGAIEWVLSGAAPR